MQLIESRSDVFYEHSVLLQLRIMVSKFLLNEPQILYVKLDFILCFVFGGIINVRMSSFLDLFYSLL